MKTKNILIREYCDDCRGHGELEGHGTDCTIHPCDVCKGKGYIERKLEVVVQDPPPELKISILGKKMSRKQAEQLVNHITKKLANI